jgi:hypothetical protein
MRKILALTLAAALGLSFVVGTIGDAEAKKKSSSKAKQCTATTIDNKKVSFSCKATEKCCFDGLMAKGNCVPAGQICF